MANNQDIDKGGWAIFYSELCKQIKGLESDGVKKSFQFAGMPMEAAWWQDTEFNAYQIIDREPQALDGYYTPSSKNIHLDYGTFLNNVRLNVAPQNPDYVKTDEALKAANEGLSSAKIDANNRYQAWKKNNPTHSEDYPDIKTAKDWLSSEGSAENEKIKAAQKKVDAYQQEIAHWQDAQSKPLQDAIKNYNDHSKNWWTITAPSGGNREVPIMSITPNLNTDLQSWKTGLRNFNEIKITRGTSVYQHWKVCGGADASYFDGFFGGNVGGSITFDSDVWADNQMELTIDLQDVKLYTLDRADWWIGGMLSEYKNGPFYDSRFTPATFFGEDGTLKLIPSAVLVGFRPKCELTISDFVYSRHSTDWEGHAGIRIGPFQISSKTHKVTVIENSEKHTKTITFAPTDDRPLIIGVLSDLNLA